MTRYKSNLLRDGFYIIASLAVAIVIGQTNAVGLILASTDFPYVIMSFISGIFFTSVFTTAPAMVALAEIAVGHNIIVTAIFGGLGALVGDVIIFRFVRDHIAGDLHHIFHNIRSKKLSLFIHGKFWRLKAFRWILPLIGALIIASPLPDELGLTILGFSKLKTSQIIPLTFVFNTAGVLLIGLVARAI